MVRLASVQRLAALPADVRELVRAAFREISADARARGNEAWRKHKPPMAAYWKANAVHFRHLALAVRGQKDTP
jgi:hypothetical protein